MKEFLSQVAKVLLCSWLALAPSTKPFIMLGHWTDCWTFTLSGLSAHPLPQPRSILGQVLLPLVLAGRTMHQRAWATLQKAPAWATLQKPARHMQPHSSFHSFRSNCYYIMYPVVFQMQVFRMLQHILWYFSVFTFTTSTLVGTEVTDFRGNRHWYWETFLKPPPTSL